MWYGENPMPHPFPISSGDLPSGPPPRGRTVVLVAARMLNGMLVYNLFARGEFQTMIQLLIRRSKPTLLEYAFQVRHFVYLSSR